MPWSKPCGGAWRRNVMITFLGQLATLALLSTLASWEPLGPNKGRTGLTNACAPGLPTRQSLCQTAIPAQTPVTREQLLLPSCHCLWARGASPVASACPPAARSWRNFPRNWRKQDMDTTRIPPGCAPSGRPIERTVPHLLIDSRPGPKSGAGCRLTTLLTLLHCQVSRSVRVPALSVGAGEGNSLAYQRRLQVPKLNGVQVTDGKQEPTHKWNRCVKRSFMRACNRAIRHGQAQPLYLCTFRFLQIPEECLAADHRCLALSRMLTECWRRQPTPSLDGMARTGPQPHVCFEMWFGCTSFQVTVSKCEKAVFWRCSAARPPLGTERQQSQYTRFSVCPPGATHSSQDYTFVQRKTSWLWTLIRFCTLLLE